MGLGRDRIYYYGFLFLRWALRLLPVPLAAAIGEGWGRFIGLFLGRERKIAKRQLEFAARASARKLGDVSVTDVFGGAGRAIAEAMVINRLIRKFPDPSAPFGQRFPHIDTLGVELVEELQRNQSGGVGLAAHIGCFELLAAYFVHCGVSFKVLGRYPNYPSVGRMIERVRVGYGVEMLWRHEASAARQLLNILSNGEVVAALVDQDTALDSVFAPFFGIPAASPAAPIKMGVHLRLPIFSAFIYRTAPDKHRIEVRNIDYDPDDPRAPVLVTEEYNRRLEELVASHPEQWLWWHRRWRREPPGPDGARTERVRSTAEYLEWLREQTEMAT